MHLTEIRDSHLKYRNLMLGADIKNRQWQSDLIVEIARGLEHRIFLRQYRSDHLLRARLADTSRDSDHFDIQLPAIEGGNLFHCLRCGIHKDIRSCRMIQRSFREYGKCAFFKHIRNKTMAVHTLALDWNEQIIFLHLAAVCDCACNHFLQIRRLTDISAFTCLCDIFQSHIWHTILKFVLIITSKHA